MLHLVLGLQAGDGFEEARMRACGVEHENPPGFRVNQQAWIAEAVEPRARAHKLLRLPGNSVVVAAAQEKIYGIGEVVQVGSAVVGSQHSSPSTDGEGRDAVLAVAAHAADGQDVLDVGYSQREFGGIQEVGGHTSMVAPAAKTTRNVDE